MSSTLTLLESFCVLQFDHYFCFRKHLEQVCKLYILKQLHLQDNKTTFLSLLLVFSVTPFKIDQNKNQNRSIDKVQNLGNERRYIYKDPRLDSGQRNLSYTRYPQKCFTQTYRDLYGDAMLVTHLDELQHGGRKPAKISVTEFCYKSVNLFCEKLINIKVILFLIHSKIS